MTCFRFCLGIFFLGACSASDAGSARPPTEEEPSDPDPMMTPPPGVPEGSGGSPEVVPPGTGGTSPGERVTFDWPEAPLDGSEKCEAGRYAGTFECNYIDTSGGSPPVLVTGPIELTLEESVQGEFLEVSGGKLEGAALLAITFTAELSGRLDCAAKRFEGNLINGSYGILPFPPGGGFSGPTHANYAAAGPALTQGVWELDVIDTMGMPLGSCDGTWTASRVP